jgi:hypothetical protein
MQTTTEIITPAVASEYLLANTQNRPLNRAHVQFLADQMSRGAWLLTGDAIRFSINGRLLDGQHHLEAIVMSQATITTTVIRGLNEDTFNVMDTGRLRQAGDILSIEKIENANITAAIIRMILRHEQGDANVMSKGTGGRNRKGSASNAAILDYVRQNRQWVEEVVKFASGLYTHSRLLTQSEWGFLYHHLSSISKEDAVVFLTRVATGIGMEEGMPQYALRRKLEQSQIAGYRLTATEKLGVVSKAWNAYRTKQTVKLVTFNAAKEQVPVLL